MRTVNAQFLFDFGSPNAYLAHKVIPAIEARTGATFEYVPILLGGLFRLTGNRSPMEAFAGIKNKPEYGRLEMQRFIRRHGLTAFRMNPHFPVNTLQIMRGAIAASHDGSFARYVDAVFGAMWERGLKMDDPAVIASVLDQAGLDGSRLLEAINQPAVKETLLGNTQRAFERGAFGAPTFFVDDEIFFGKDSLRDVEEEIIRVRAA
ncbi:2-hydroxychromene-2-carboxylate isomerase [Cupriavidus gilardii]|uniref:2-hydroxychromene-2-carboxylate isomerase n=1 Tax=Cupriavidus gilardii TaxID=82541 RepID=UPI0007E34B70|nr:2-hydroxychromene-2-carboxylate isomerase [Cupriavidus gilardii]